LIQGLLISIAILLRIVSNPLGNVFQKQLVNRGNNPLIINFLSYVFLSIPCIFFAFDVEWKALPSGFWFYSVLIGGFGAFGNGFLIKALEKGDISVLGPINSYKSLVGILAGIVLLGEMPGIWGMAGVILIIYGSYFILDTTEDRFTWKLLKRTEIQYRFFALILTAIEAVFVKKVILISSTTIACISWCWFGTFFSLLFLLIYNFNPKTELGKFQFKDLGKMVSLVICAGTMLITTTYVFDHMPVGYALSLFQLSTIGSVLLGHKVFDEQDIRKKLLGSVIMIVGSVIIILCQGR
jgi:drug/metabolite transporter (DMT)-like permease